AGLRSVAGSLLSAHSSCAPRNLAAQQPRQCAGVVDHDGARSRRAGMQVTSPSTLILLLLSRQDRGDACVGFLMGAMSAPFDPSKSTGASRAAPSPAGRFACAAVMDHAPTSTARLRSRGAFAVSDIVRSGSRALRAAIQASTADRDQPTACALLR